MKLLTFSGSSANNTCLEGSSNLIPGGDRRSSVVCSSHKPMEVA
jgi:hypothetical protein